MDKLAIARQTLALAEQRAGLRVVRTTASHRRVNGEVSSDHFPAPEYLRAALPEGLPRRGAINVQGSHFAGLLLASIASEHKAWVAFLGSSDVGWDCAESLGIDTGRVVTVPRIEIHTPQVVQAAIDGFDVVVLGNLRLDVRERRVLQRRALSKGALLIGWQWPNATLAIDCRLIGAHGIDHGIGHIRAVDYAVSTHRGTAHIRYCAEGCAAPLVPATPLEADPTTALFETGAAVAPLEVDPAPTPFVADIAAVGG